MAKITMFDSNNGKFSNVLRFHWKEQGHDVEYTPLWDSRLCVDRDAIFFDWIDTSIQRASNPDDSQYQDHGTKIPTGNVIARCHDIDMWVGNLAGVRPGFIRHLVFVADHIRRVAEERGEIPDGCQVHTIKHGIDLTKWTFRPKPPGTKRIGWVGRYDHNKHPELALQILMELPRDYTLHLVGRRHQAAWQVKYWDSLIKRNNLNVVFEEDIPDLNQWWEDKDFMLSTSGKEAFGYSIAEAMAKGIKPIIHHFYGAEEVWPEELLYSSVSRAVAEITGGGYAPAAYRNTIGTRYPIDRFYAAYDQLIAG